MCTCTFLGRFKIKINERSTYVLRACRELWKRAALKICSLQDHLSPKKLRQLLIKFHLILRRVNYLARPQQNDTRRTDAYKHHLTSLPCWPHPEKYLTKDFQLDMYGLKVFASCFDVSLLLGSSKKHCSPGLCLHRYFRFSYRFETEVQVLYGLHCCSWFSKKNVVYRSWCIHMYPEDQLNTCWQTYMD
jgi:hypothetical protein